MTEATSGTEAPTLGETTPGEPTPDALLEAALAYGGREFRVFPIFEALAGTNGTGVCSCGRECGSPGKHPRTKHGLLSASSEPTLIRHWWSALESPSASIGIATGPASRIWVLDVDAHKGGLEELAQLEATHGALPLGPRSQTGAGGVHILFAWPLEGGIRQGADVVARGIDTRAAGGYIVAPPSRHVSGRCYDWGDTWPLPIPDAPAWLLERVLVPAEAVAEAVNVPERPTLPPGQAEEIGDKVLRRYLEAVARGSNRNDSGFALACQLRDNRLTKLQARPILETYAQRVARAGSHPYSAMEARKSLEQAYTRPAREPWSEPLVPVFEPLGEAMGPRALTPVDEELAAVDAARPIRAVTDIGNAERFADRYGDTVRYVYTWERWLTWDGTRWRQDDTDEVVRLAKDTVRQIWDDARRMRHDGESAKALAKHAIKSEASRAIAALLTLGKAEEGMGVLPEHLDRHPWLLNLANGTLDLRTGVLGPHRPEELHTKVVPLAYDPDATCPRWEAFLHRIMGGSEALVGFLQRSVGYWLTGSTREQCMWILHGSGSNGKSTFLEVIRLLCADYAQQSDPKSFVERKTESISNDLAALKGARLVVASETEAGRRLAEGLVKQVTGGEPIVARFLHKEFFSFLPELKLVMATNHKPQIRGTDHAIWRRIRLTPFEVTIPPEERDRELKSRLLAELPGILAWAVRGCLEYLQVGLQEPAAVLEATADYKESMDTMGAFFDECLEFGPAYKASAKGAYQAYLQWAEASNETPLGKRAFGISLGDRGLRPGKDGHGARFWIGVRIKSTADTADTALETNYPPREPFLREQLLFSAVSAVSAVPPSSCLHSVPNLLGKCTKCGEQIE